MGFPESGDCVTFVAQGAQRRVARWVRGGQVAAAQPGSRRVWTADGQVWVSQSRSSLPTLSAAHRLCLGGLWQVSDLLKKARVPPSALGLSVLAAREQRDETRGALSRSRDVVSAHLASDVFLLSIVVCLVCMRSASASRVPASVSPTNIC